MACYEGWTDAHPNDFYPSGLAPDKVASVTRVLEPDRWSIAEERTAELIACILPTQLSEERRRAVTSYVQRLITNCISCQVLTFGSVPLKTYLPDGDIDLTAFGNNESSKDTWANEVRDMLMSEEKNENAEFCVKEVQYIQAEVKKIKCLVDDIVVYISFNQLGGLCTLCFLDAVDSFVRQNHLFKRSIILIKAWCYYESRILGAHHGLISTYALETLVLYIFHVFNDSFAGPLEVLYRFLEFFSKFDWDNFCVGLWGPVPIRSLPDMTADPPRKDGGELLFSKFFLDACSKYIAFPIGQENHELPFMSKHFNVIDPLRANNNLGRSVSKGNFFRIRGAFAFGAQCLARLLDCPKENIVAEVNQFFKYTLDRHGKQLRHDAPRIMADDPHGVSFHQFCVENLQTFWRFSIHGQPVALTNVPRLILRKILNVVKSCHDNNMSSGNLLDNIIVINNKDVVLAVGPVPLDLVNPRLTMHNDLFAVWDLVLHAVNTTTPQVLPEAVRSLNNLYALLRPFYERGDDLRRIEFFLFNSPLFLDVKGKYLLYRKILNLAEHRRRSFFQNLDLTGVGDWLASVRNPLLIAVRDYDNYVNLPLYMTHAGSVQFYRNALGHLNQGQLHFMSDASIMIVLEDDIPMVLPELFNALVQGMDQNPACTQICGMTLDDFLRAPITDFV